MNGQLDDVLDGTAPNPLEDKVPTDTPCDRPEPPYVPQVGDGVDDAGRFTCPLVLDLGQTGIELSASSGPGSVFWDIDKDGFREASAWVGKEEGLLAIDKNNDGKINDHGELFGSEAESGFSMLSAYDSNNDNVIDGSDVQFDKLRVWIDSNSNGYSEEGELHTLAELGITSINLNASQVSYDIAGNPITAQSTFTMNGQERQIVDANFSYDNTNSIYDGDVEINYMALWMPQLRG